MNLMDLFVKIGVDDQASGAISKITGGIGKGLATAAKVGTAAIGAAAAGITALTKASIDQYAEYEQLVGGAELLFGNAFDTVKKNAEEAYKTVQMSQSEYLQQVNGFSTGLKTALGGNEQAAADLSHRIIQAEADIIAATGNTAENVQNAFNGIMKSNFTMLDNLQLGITPTKEGFQEVIDKVNEWNAANGEATKYQMGNLADMQSALVDYVEMQGLAGYAANEAGRTITGSLSAAKSAWKNLLTGLADGNADIGGLIDNLVTTIVGDGTESNLGVLGNILPAIERALGGVVKLISGAAPKIIEILPELIDQIVPPLIEGATAMVGAVIEVLPDLLSTVVSALVENAPLLIEAAIGLVESLIGGIQENYQLLVDGAIGIVVQLANGILNMLPEIIKLGLDLLTSLAFGIAEAIPQLIPTIIDVVLGIVDMLTDPTTLSNLLDAALQIIIELAYGLMDAIPALVQAVSDIIIGIADFLIDPNNLAMILKAALDVVIALGTGLINAIPTLLKHIPKLWQSIIDNFRGVDWGQLGKNLVDGFKNGISRAWTSLKKWFKNLFGDLIGIAKKILGIKSPSRVFRSIGAFTAEGFGIGFDDEFANVKDNMENAMAFDDVEIGANIHRSGSYGGVGAVGGTSFGDVIIQIDGARYNDEQSLAAAIAEQLQNMTDRKAAVYA